jgi:tetratricopeptide (TPR) repeat protein
MAKNKWERSHQRLVRKGVLTIVKEFDFSAFAFSFDEEEQILFYKGILEAAPGYLEARVQLANLLTKVGRYEEGLLHDLDLAQRRPNDPTILYNLACSYSLVGRLESSCQTLFKAMEKGFDNLKLLFGDQDLDALRKSHFWPEIVERLKALSKNDKPDNE